MDRSSRAHRIRRWLGELGARTLFIEPGSPWENGYIESFNGKLRDELLKREIFYTLEEAQVLIERWRQTYNRRRPHSSLGNRPPAPEAYRVPNWGSPLTAAAAFGLTWNLAQRTAAGHVHDTHPLEGNINAIEYRAETSSIKDNTLHRLDLAQPRATLQMVQVRGSRPALGILLSAVGESGVHRCSRWHQLPESYGLSSWIILSAVQSRS